MRDPKFFQDWRDARVYTPEQLQTARLVLEEVKSGRRLDRALRSHPLPNGQLIAKHILVAAYRDLVARGEWVEDPDFLPLIRMKPVRTLSGVSTVTVNQGVSLPRALRVLPH